MTFQPCRRRHLGLDLAPIYFMRSRLLVGVVGTAVRENSLLTIAYVCNATVDRRCPAVMRTYVFSSNQIPSRPRDLLQGLLHH